MKTQIKEEIKKLALDQKYYRDQRKTKKNKLKRTMDAGAAWVAHQRGRYRIYHLLILYAEVRNREPQISEKYGYSRSFVDKLKEEFSLRISA